MTLLGHDSAWREWREAMAGARMHHAWLLAGKKGLGKSAFALAAARELVAEAGVPQPDGPHPDILVLTHLPKDDKEEKKREAGQPYELARSIRMRGTVDPVFVENPSEIGVLLRNVLQPGDVLLTQGAGNVGVIAQELAQHGLYLQPGGDES